MNILRIPYYLHTLLELLLHSKASFLWQLHHLFIQKEKEYHLTLYGEPNMRLLLLHPSDLLITAETVIYDVYNLRGLKNPRFIVDIGSAFGDFACIAALLYPEAEILAFEPDPEQYACLEKNVAINHLPNVRAHRVAIGTKNSYMLTSGNVKSQSSVMQHGGPTVRVTGQRLSTYISPERYIDLLKIDCEGAELEILESIDKHTFEKIHRIEVEYHNFIIPHEDELITRMLEKYGFHVSIKPERHLPIGILTARRRAEAHISV